MTTRTALVTGANKGIGFETARQLAQHGFIVWLGSRDRPRGEAAAKKIDGDVRVVTIDVTDPDSITAAAARVGEETGALDVLVNNAGIAVTDGEGFPSVVRIDTVQRALDANAFGPLRVTQAFLPLVRQAAAGRIVNVSSTMGSLTERQTSELPVMKVPAFAYSTSKTMLNALTVWLAAELADTPIAVTSVCPGENATDMGNAGNPAARHPAQGAKVVVHAATLPPGAPTGRFLDADGQLAW